MFGRIAQFYLFNNIKDGSFKVGNQPIEKFLKEFGIERSVKDDAELHQEFSAGQHFFDHKESKKCAQFAIQLCFVYPQSQRS